MTRRKGELDICVAFIVMLVLIWVFQLIFFFIFSILGAALIPVNPFLAAMIILSGAILGSILGAYLGFRVIYTRSKR